jgi:hypothetical protein
MSVKNSGEREHQRAEVDLEIRVEMLGGAVKARMIDIGEQGLRYSRPTGSDLQEDREVLIDLHLPGDEVGIRVLGAVAGTRDNGRQREVSVTFFALPDADARRIRSFVERTSGSYLAS